MRPTPNLDSRAYPKLRYARTRFLFVHRISLSRKHKTQNPEPVDDSKLSGEFLIQAFKRRALGTGGRTPYHIFIPQSGDVEQLLPLDARGAHASGGYNSRSIAIAVAGKLDTAAMLPAQWEALVDACESLQDWRPKGLTVVGHTEQPNASRDPKKRCPGRKVPMDELRRALGPPGGYNEAACRLRTRSFGWILDDKPDPILELAELWQSGHQKNCICEMCSARRTTALADGRWAELYRATMGGPNRS